MQKVTETHRRIIAGEAEGICINGNWRWLLDGKPVTQTAKNLIKDGLVEPSYYRGGKAGLWPTDAGREWAQKNSENQPKDQ